MAISRLASTARTASANAIAALVDAGTASGTIQVRSGAIPATPNTAATGLLLGTLTFSDPAFSAAVAGVATANPITGDAVADATGAATWFRVLDSSGNAVFDGDITVTGGGGSLTLDNINVIAGGTISINTFTLTQPL